MQNIEDRHINSVTYRLAIAYQILVIMATIVSSERYYMHGMTNNQSAHPVRIHKGYK